MSDAPDGNTHAADFKGNVQSSHNMALPRFNPRPAPPREPNNINIPRITPLSDDEDESAPADADTDKDKDKDKAESRSQEDPGIPKIVPSADQSPEVLAEGLEGKFVDEFGNILDWDGTVLGRVSGDLPSMVGRPVSASGEIQDTDGEVVGYVSENYAKPPLKPLAGNLKTDEEGNIYNGEGQIIGKLNSPPGKEKEEPSNKSAAPSPSELYLDVKSTHDGIQLIIKIPTVFKKGDNSN